MKIFTCSNFRLASIVTLGVFLIGIGIQILPGLLNLGQAMPALLWYLGLFLLLAGILGFLSTLALVYFPGKGEKFDECV